MAKEQIDRLQERLRFRIEIRDVDSDPTWADRYGDEVPVGLVAGRKVFKYRVDPRRLERALRASDRQHLTPGS